MRRYAFPVAFLLVLALALAGCSRPSQNAENPADAGSPTLQSRPGAGDTAAAKPIVVPAGTALTVKMGQSVGSKTSRSGDSFKATVARPIDVDGVVAIPQGAEVTGHVADAVPLGRFKGGARLQLALDSLTIQGKSYDISAEIARSKKGKGKRTAVMAGGGAGLGALIGGLAGGGKGALIGAAAGAGAGTAGAGLTGNQNIVVPAESALTFHLQQPIEIK